MWVEEGFGGSPLMKQQTDRLRLQSGQIPSSYAKSLLRAVSMAREYEQWEESVLNTQRFLTEEAPAPTRATPTKSPTPESLGSWDAATVNCQLAADMRRAKSMTAAKEGTPRAPSTEPSTFLETPRRTLFSGRDSNQVVTPGKAEAPERTPESSAVSDSGPSALSVPDIAEALRAFLVPDSQLYLDELPMEYCNASHALKGVQCFCTRGGIARRVGMPMPERCGVATACTRWLQGAVEHILTSAEQAGTVTTDGVMSPDTRRHLLLSQAQVCGSLVNTLCKREVVCHQQTRLISFLWQQQATQLQAAQDEIGQLTQEASGLDEMKAELEASYVPWATHQSLTDRYSALKEDFLQARKEKEATVIQMEELSGKLKAKEGNDKTSEVLDLPRKLQGMQEQLYDADAKAYAAKKDYEQLEKISNAEQLKEYQAGKCADQEQMTELQSKILQLTPRLARRYIYPANMLSDENRLELERAMEIGIPRQTLIPLLRSGHLIPFVKHLGTLADKPDMRLNREAFCRALEEGKGDAKKIVDILSKDPQHTEGLECMQSMLHHRISIDDAATILFGKTQDGFNIQCIKRTIGVLHSVDKSSVSNMLKLAAMTNKERFDELIGEKSMLQNQIADLRRKVFTLNQQLEGKNKRVQAKIQRHNKTRKIPPIEVFVETDWSNEPYFKPMGTGKNVPAWLRYDGGTDMVVNTKMSKVDVEKMIKKIWKTKSDHDRKSNKGSELVSYIGQFILEEIKQKKEEADPERVANMGYNLLWGLKRWSYDADCALMLQVVLGEISESVHISELQMQNDIIHDLRAADSSSHGCSITGYINKQIILSLMETKYFKKEEELEELKKALDEQSSNPIVQYGQLFDEDENCDQGPFAECLRDQNLTERFQYFKDLNNALFNQSYDDDKVCLDRAKVAFKCVEPDISENSLRKYLERLFGVSKPPSSVRVGVVEGMARLRRGDIYKEEKAKTDGVSPLGGRRSSKQGSTSSLTGLYEDEKAAAARDSILSQELTERSEGDDMSKKEDIRKALLSSMS